MSFGDESKILEERVDLNEARIEVLEDGARHRPEIQPWCPQHPEHDKPEFSFPNGDPDWRARIQNCIDEYGAVHFTRMFEIVLTAQRQAIIIRNGTRMTGEGSLTGVSLDDGNDWLDGDDAPSQITIFRPNNILSGDRCDGFYCSGFTVDGGNQANHDVTIKLLSALGDRALAERMVFRRFRAGNKAECFVARCYAEDQNIPDNKWLGADPARHGTIRNCIFEDPLANFDRGETTRPDGHGWEITQAFADIVTWNTFRVSRDDRQTAIVHCAHPQAYDRTECTHNHNTGENVATLDWHQQPSVHISKNKIVHSNTGV